MVVTISIFLCICSPPPPPQLHSPTLSLNCVVPTSWVYLGAACQLNLTDFRNEHEERKAGRCITVLCPLLRGTKKAWQPLGTLQKRLLWGR